MFVGGEFYYDDCWRLEQAAPPAPGQYFLNGGRACLTVIADYLLDHGIRKILMPTYLCPTILDVFDRRGLAYDFYRIRPDFSTDLEELAEKAPAFQAVYLINYFGFAPAAEVREAFRDLRQGGVIVVEDNAQAGFSDERVGNFTFNSLRKLAPFDGGYLASDEDLTLYLEKYESVPNRRLAPIRAYRKGLYEYLVRGKGSHARLEKLFTQAEGFYETDMVIQGDPQERQCIERLDWEGIRHARRSHYRYLSQLIASIPGIAPIFPELQTENTPLGLPVYFSGVSRDQVNEELGKAGIGLTIHWEALRDDPRTRGNPEVLDMVCRILTLAIDQRTSRVQMDYLAEHLDRAIQKAKRSGRTVPITRM